MSIGRVSNCLRGYSLEREGPRLCLRDDDGMFLAGYPIAQVAVIQQMVDAIARYWYLGGKATWVEWERNRKRGVEEDE